MWVSSLQGLGFRIWCLTDTHVGQLPSEVPSELLEGLSSLPQLGNHLQTTDSTATQTAADSTATQTSPGSVSLE